MNASIHGQCKQHLECNTVMRVFLLCTLGSFELVVLAGAASGSADLLPAPSSSTNWTASLVTDSSRDSDLIYRFDGQQAANVPDHVVPQNLTDQFTIATWMKHGPSPGLRAEKETLLCNSDKTGEETLSLLLASNFTDGLTYFILFSFFFFASQCDHQCIVTCIVRNAQGLLLDDCNIDLIYRVGTVMLRVIFSRNLTDV